MNATNITCNNANNGMASISVTGGTLNYTYQWSTTPIQTTFSVANLSANTYTVLVTDAKGCTVSGSANIINPTPVTLSVTNANTSCGLCNGKIYLFPSGGNGPFTYSPTPFIPIINDSAINVCNGIYNFTVSDVNGCSGSSSTNLTGPGGSTGFKVSAGSDVTLCNGFSANVGGVPTLTGGNLPYTYTWTPGVGLSSPTASNPLANPTSTTTYVILASDAMGCTKKDTVVVTVNAIPFANAGADISYCYGLIGAIGGPTTPGLTYQWAPSTGLNNATISNPQVNVLTSQNYTLTVTDANGCQNMDQVYVTMNPLPVVSAGPDVIILNGSSATLNGSGANTYLWTPPTSLSGSTIANPVATPNATTTYVLTGTDANGCVDNDLVTVFVYAANGIDELGNSIGLKIYPNPFVDYATIEFELYKNTKIGIRLFDAGGKEVKQIKNENFSFGKHSVTFDVNELARGMYLLMLQTEDGVSIRRLVKQ